MLCRFVLKEFFCANKTECHVSEGGEFPGESSNEVTFDVPAFDFSGRNKPKFGYVFGRLFFNGVFMF